MTATYREFVAARFLKRNVGAEGLIHAGVGMIGEVAEYFAAVTLSHKIEELGDIEFYWEAAHIVLDVDELRPWPYHEALLQNAAHFLDTAKKVWVYGKEVDKPAFCLSLEGIRSCLVLIYRDIGTSQEEVRAANVAKLLLRYPTTYTDQLAAARLDKVELAPRLENWFWLGNRLHGNVSNDPRFGHNVEIDTSTVVLLNEAEGWAQTKNTRYTLGRKAHS